MGQQEDVPYFFLLAGARASSSSHSDLQASATQLTYL